MTKEMVAAKTATNALFLAREEQARQTGLKRCRNFITRILGGPPWKKALSDADCHVLTFNYDQLFEIAFLDSFLDFNTESLYDGEGLNSGFRLYGDYDFVNPTPDRFSFLKLHGSAGWRVSIKRGGGRSYGLSVPVKPTSLIEIEKRFPNQWKCHLDWEPLIAFPGERQNSQDYFATRGQSSDYAWAPYIDSVWEHAAKLVAIATQIRVIGYSFNQIDSRPMVERLLNKATCEKIMIQNRDDVRENLEGYKELRGRLDFDPTPF
jgi:hypothetical protein